MADEDEIAVALEFVAGIGDHPAFGRFHRRALGESDIDAVVAGAPLLPKPDDDTALGGPAEFGRRCCARRGDARRGVDRLGRGSGGSLPGWAAGAEATLAGSGAGAAATGAG